MEQDWVIKFQTQGFAVLENFLTDGEISDLKNSSTNIIDQLDPESHRCIFEAMGIESEAKDRDAYFLTSGDKVRCFYEKEAMDSNGKLLVDKLTSVNKIGHALHILEPAFARVTFSDKVKQPRIGGEVGPHQDASYLYCEPLRVAGLWFALEDTTLENGCLHFLPGSHQDGLHGNYRYVLKTENGCTRTVYEGEQPSYKPELFIPVPVRKGTLVVFDGLAVHRSEANRSSVSRHAYTIHIYDGASKWSERNWLQPTDAGNFVHVVDK